MAMQVLKEPQDKNVNSLTREILYKGKDRMDGLKTALEAKGKTAYWYAAIGFHYSK